jgi:8-oxo-dGTP pyrophosphatase MutT (NUDIX family)
VSAPADVPVRDAATVLLLRGDTPAEVFLVRRTRKAAFMANAMVFPGGRLDDGDADDALAARCDLSRAEAAARLDLDDGGRALALLIAGVRETFEEAGVLLARRGDAPLTFTDPAEAARFDAHRDALNAGETTLTAIAEAEDLTLATADLRYQARWITPPIEKRRFDARFFAVRAPRGQRPLHEGVETTASAWMTPAAAVAGYRAGDLELAPPTLRILDELAVLGSVEAILAHRVAAPAAIQPQPSFVDGALHLLLPGDPDFDPPGATPNRVVLRDGRWHSEGRGY